MKSMMKLTARLGLLVCAAGIGSARADDVITLKLANPYPVGHPSYVLAKEYIDDIHKFTHNKVKVSYFPAEQLGKAKDMLTLCSKGVADICQIHVTYFSGQLPYTNIVVLPYWTTATEGTRVFQTMLETSAELQEEFHKYGVKALQGSATPSYDVATTKKPVRTLDDLKGLKLKTAGGLYDNIAKRYGIIPVSIPASETYEAVQRGVVDGVVFNYPSTKSYHLNDLVKYMTNGMRCGGYPGAVIINEKTWEKLPKDVQAGILQADQASVARYGKYWDDAHQAVLKQFRDEGIRIYDLTPEQKVEWNKRLEGLGEEYVAEMDKRGFGKIGKVYADYKKTSAEIAR